LLEGDWRAKARAKAGTEPKDAGEPERPAHLTEAQAAVWDQVAAILRAMGVLAATPAMVLERYAVALVRYRRAVAFLDKHGEKYPILDERGKVKGFGQFPESYLVGKLAGELLKIEQETGMTPASRTRVTVPKEAQSPDEGSLEAFNGGMRIAT
jgi:P27 family predicted phage terminase small subunit